MKDLYIYYRVRSEHARSLQLTVRTLQQSLSREYGIVTALKRRPEEQQGQHTWMEVYLAIPDGFDLRLEQAVAQTDLVKLIEGKRNMEYFLDCSTCA
ncbi:DUF4936 family protein [Noviherbaspirillum sp.]|uniref:DUF4936 family protein n=1 Tax=Noviherbaspirillum sp. TaxID=1926288 RepID=UPI002FE05387